VKWHNPVAEWEAAPKPAPKDLLSLVIEGGALIRPWLKLRKLPLRSWPRLCAVGQMGAGYERGGRVEGLEGGWRRKVLFHFDERVTKL
jgi:hypothetical protein